MFLKYRCLQNVLAKTYESRVPKLVIYIDSKLCVVVFIVIDEE